MQNPAEMGVSLESHSALIKPEPLVVEFGKPFSISPNLNVETIPPHAVNALNTDAGILVDLVEFNIPEVDLAGSIEVLRLHVGVEEHYDNITEPAGPVRPYTLAIGFDGEQTENSVIVNLKYRDREFIGAIDYDSLSTEQELVGYVDDNSWLDKETDWYAYPVFPGSDIPNVEFTIFAAPQTGEVDKLIDGDL